MQVVSLQFIGCFKPFPLVTIRTNLGERQHRLLNTDVYSYVAKELVKEGVQVVRYLADSVERHMALGVQRLGYFG